MTRKKEWLAMLLAGGQGSRLHVLTKRLAKPAVPYGGKYRIIDFTLSNCVNSGIDTVGVLTQYQPLELNEYIGNGQPWDLDRNHGGIHVLSPYQKASGSDWYKGTANAIYQNIHFIEGYDPDYIVILSGDHIYKMNYERMLDFHKKHDADCTIAVISVPWEEASRFGIIDTDEDYLIREFAEKPERPKSNLASMGVYIFNWKMLRRYLESNERDAAASKDFGKDIIPAMLADGQKLYAYPFEGYWKDVGTIDSLWEANMDLLDPNVPLELHDPSWKIYARNPVLPPHYVGESANVQNAMVADGCNIFGTVDFSVLFAGVTVEEGAEVRDSIIMPGTVIKKGAVVQYAIVAEDCIIGENSVIGMRPEQVDNKNDWGIAVIGPGAVLSADSVVRPKDMIDADRMEVFV